mgnify:CR=1 FL=1|jgi:hypothetical protein
MPRREPVTGVTEILDICYHFLLMTNTEANNLNRGEKMKLRWCKKCNKMCHCTQAGSDKECTNCDCKEPEGLVIDDTENCESCQ